MRFFIVLILMVFMEHFFGLAFGLYIDYKLGADIYFTLHFDWTSHLLDDLLADREPKASPWRVSSLVFFKFTKVNEKILDSFLRHSYTSIDYTYLKLKIFFIYWSLFNRSVFSIWIIDLLLIENFYVDRYLSFFVREFQRIWNEIQEDLEKPPFVPVNVFEHLKIRLKVYDSFQLNLIFGGLMRNYLESLIDRACQIKIIIWNVELIVFHFRQIKKIVDQIFHHFLGINLSLEHLGGVNSPLLHLLEHTFIILYLCFSLLCYDFLLGLLIYYLEPYSL